MYKNVSRLYIMLQLKYSSRSPKFLPGSAGGALDEGPNNLKELKILFSLLLTLFQNYLLLHSMNVPSKSYKFVIRSILCSFEETENIPISLFSVYCEVIGSDLIQSVHNWPSLFGPSFNFLYRSSTWQGLSFFFFSFELLPQL